MLPWNYLTTACSVSTLQQVHYVSNKFTTKFGKLFWLNTWTQYNYTNVGELIHTLLLQISYTYVCQKLQTLVHSRQSYGNTQKVDIFLETKSKNTQTSSTTHIYFQCAWHCNAGKDS